MVIFRKGKRKLKKSDMEYALEGLRLFGIADCFWVGPSREFCETHTKEEIIAERKRMIEKCKKILKEYE